jgi:tetratricopeptide (TPR) repeat protein
LLIREGATDLVRTPSTTGIDNLLVEKREYRLAEFGPALITEESESHGFIDRAYRSSYGTGRDPKQLQREFENYTKNVYLADGETKVEAGDGLDLSKPFVLRVEAHQARRGYTSLRDARAALFLSAIASRLPEYFRKSDEELKKEEERLEKPRPARTADFVLPAPFITEWRCKFLPPPGFKLRSLPEDRTQDFGPAKLVQHWEAANDGAVTGVIRFDTVKARYTPAEAEALRKAIVELRKANALIVAFDQEGYSLLTAGKAKEAFAAFDRLIKLHPAEALHHIQIASALLEAGLGESARKEAHEAVRLEPQSAAAHKNLGWVLQHDLIGRRFKKGFDLEGALAEYRAALDLDPDDKELRTDYAILLEHDASGERYSAQANLGEAIAQYRKLKEQKSDWEYLDANLSAALFWSARWHEVEDLVGSLPASEDNNAMLIAARTALQGSAAGIRRATELTSDEKSKAQALMTAARKLLLSRCYPEAADLFTAANTGDSGLETVAMVRKTKKYEDLPKPTDDAAGAVKTLLTYLLGPPTSDPKAAGMFTQEWKADGAEGPVELDDLKNFRLTIRYRAGSEFPNDVRGDIILSNIKLTAEGDDQLGYRVMLQMMELNGQSVYVVKAQNGYRIVPNNNAALARVVLEKVQAGDLKGARQWLDWAREESSVQAGEDPLAGSIFARVWRRGQNGDRTAIQVAAASLMLDHKQVEPLLPVLETAREQASTETEKANLDMILFDAYSTLQRWPEALAAMEDVLHSYPDSDTAFVGYCYAALHLKNWDAVARAAQRRLEKIPHDEPALMMLGQSAGAQGNFTQALELIKPGISNPKAGVELLNDYAWNGLFVSPPPADMVEIAQRAARVSENKNFAVVHTLAAVYAEIGRPAEARKLMLDMIDQMGMDEPNEPAWYVFGRIAEQYGQTEAALAAYERTREKDVKDNDDPFSNISAWMLAQRRSKLIKASLERESGK